MENESQSIIRLLPIKLSLITNLTIFMNSFKLENYDKRWIKLRSFFTQDLISQGLYCMTLAFHILSIFVSTQSM